jgi:hypothetical protein
VPSSLDRRSRKRNVFGRTSRSVGGCCSEREQRADPLLEGAAEHYRRAVDLASQAEAKARALDLLAQSYDAQHLNDPKRMEPALRELIRLTPDDLAPLSRLARLQEAEGFIDAAEETPLGARHQQPDAVEPYRMLAQFYARRVTALHRQQVRTNKETDATCPRSSSGSAPTRNRLCGPAETVWLSGTEMSLY